MLRSIAFIPDGNRRYARRLGVNFARAYADGFGKTRQVFEWCLDTPGLKEATMWVISTENLQRTPAEVRVFTDLLHTKLTESLSDPLIVDNSVRVNVFGQLGLLPQRVREAAETLMSSTAGNAGYVLNLAVGYGGRQELLQAVQAAAAEGPVTEDAINRHLYVPTPPDLIVRTGGEQRLSGFMPWQSVYSELYFSQKLWPEFSREDFDDAVVSYNARQRRFGL